ncbi:hypothetical protein EVAR_94353_1 [Eumeta japonica]|uniref:Uncharacterized protein n=1 Tax=Eumeta variegata TaxID=151549 RepID=A0A4C1TPY2_EUMVA|nr:hypothetical protein EVAR_94353_1 [Eumeta japonica]
MWVVIHVRALLIEEYNTFSASYARVPLRTEERSARADRPRRAINSCRTAPAAPSIGRPPKLKRTRPSLCSLIWTGRRKSFARLSRDTSESVVRVRSKRRHFNRSILQIIGR